MLDGLRTPLIPALAVACLALAPARFLVWTNEASSVLWLPLRPLAHFGVAAASWLRPPTPTPQADAVTLAEERDELLALVQRLRSELEFAHEAIEVLEGLPRRAEPSPRPAAARVIAVDPSGIATLNVGQRHGIAAGDPVVASGGRLVGRIGDPVAVNGSVLVPASHASGVELRVRILDEGGGREVGEQVLCLLEPDGDGWVAEVDAQRVAIGATVRLDDPAWPMSAQGLRLGRVVERREVPERPLRAAIRVEPAWSMVDGPVLVVQRTGTGDLP
ncbi:MAG: hypothetical protein ACO3P9_07930 [Phycisphaerales bacterium]|jgi:hypothetical protein